MTSSLPPLDTEILLEHAQWMRVLARRLVADSERADDLSQATWQRILERPPRLDSPFRGWIATVMRNLLRAERRGAARRATREAACAGEDIAPSSHDLLERAALQRELVQAVLELAEPYRTTVLLRYFEDRTPSEIAARERVPLATVKTRLARGLARLRERLGRTHGPDGRTSLLAVLARLEPFDPPRAWPPKLALASAAMNAKLLVPLALVLVAGLAYVLASRAADPLPALAGADRPRAPERTALSGGVSALAAPAQRERAASERPARPVQSGPAHAPSDASARGRVIDLHGAGVPELEIAFLPRESPLAALELEDSSAEVVAHSGADGLFELEGPRQGRVFVRDPRWTTLLAGVPIDGRSGQECRIVVAPRIALAGLVVDEQGVPLEGAAVALEPPAALRARLAQVLDFSADVRWESRSDARGRFELAAAPALEDGVLRAHVDGLEPHEEPAPLAARSDLVLVLARPGGERAILSGTVVDVTGLAVPEALVSLGMDTTRTDADGRFSFRLDDPESFNRAAARSGLRLPDGLLRALAPGYLPAELLATRTGDGRLEWPRPLVLHLGAEALALEGRVLDARGAGLAGMRVWIADPTFFGGLQREAGGERFPELAHVEGLLSGAGPGWNWAESDDDGRFVLRGLMAREYDVAAMDPTTLQRVDLAGVSAGRRDVVLVLPTDELMPRLAGHVLDGRGQPVPNLGVFPMCDALETRIEGKTVQTQHEVAAGTTTDADGAFVLERVPARAVYLRVEGADTLPLEWGRGLEGGLERLAGEQREDLVLTVERRCHFQVELALAAEADELGVLDASGRELVVSQFFGTGRRDTERHAIVEGRSSMLAVGDQARTLVLYRAGTEVRRVPLALAPGTTTQLRL